MNTLSAIICIAMLVVMTTKQAIAVPPGQEGFLVNMDSIINVLEMSGLIAKTKLDWQKRMAIEIRGIIGAKLYALARLDSIDPDANLEGFQQWLKSRLPGKKMLALYGFGENTVADLCASIYMYDVFNVSVDIWITEPEYVASGAVFPVGDIAFQIFQMLKSKPFKGTFNNGQGAKQIEILNLDVLSNYKTLPDPDPKSPHVLAKKNYLKAIETIPKLSDDPNQDEIKNYTAMDTTNAHLKAATAEFLSNCEVEITKANSVGEVEYNIVQNICLYALVTEAVIEASPSNGDFKLTFLPTIRIALAAQDITKNGFNILVTNRNPAMGLSDKIIGMSWMYSQLGLKPLQPSFTVHLGPVNKWVLYSDEYVKILHISIMPLALEDVFQKKTAIICSLLDQGKLWKYDRNGDVTSITPLKNGRIKLDNLSYPVKVIKVSIPVAKTNPITSKFTMPSSFKDPLDTAKFMNELRGLFLGTFNPATAITVDGSF